MKVILSKIFENQKLTNAEAQALMSAIAEGQCNEAQIAAILTVFILRGIGVEELRGFRDALLERCIPFDLEGREAIDLCGTGGDAKNTFNISTLASFVVAGAGCEVVKHGNYGVSSVSGSSNMLEHFGYRFSNEADTLRRQLDRAGICFLHAPLFHPAMKSVGPVRRQLGVKTLFNMLGPIVNPAQPPYQLTGVFNLELARTYQYLYRDTGKQFIVLHSLDGYDEFSMTGPAKYISNSEEKIIAPEHFGLRRLTQADLYGGETVEASAKIFMHVLENNGTAAQNQVVVANAGLAIHCLQPAMSVADCIETARESLVSGRALNKFAKLIEVS
ncbi:MAG: anthranilate phosphoribosyltransferase [Saprospiraceae bacterium]|nr:anthranilate phosphoribosyltransferase [Saprospiraceae bacterium]